MLAVGLFLRNLNHGLYSALIAFCFPGYALIVVPLRTKGVWGCSSLSCTVRHEKETHIYISRAPVIAHKEFSST